MTIPAGWAEFNDANAVFRGRMVGASGTFSGTFASDNIEAVQELNIRDGAASAYYGFSFAAQSTSASFSIPAQPYAQVADIIIPIQIDANGIGATGYVNLYRNGTLIDTSAVRLDTASDKRTTKGNVRYRNDLIKILQVVRFIDFDVSPSAGTSYTITLSDGTYGDGAVTGGIQLRMIGGVTVGCRKR